MNWKQLYSEAHQRFQTVQYPTATKDFGTIATQFPDVRTANGLTRMIINFLTWEGWNANRTNSQGQYVEQKYNGRVVSKGWRPSGQRRGKADVQATIKGRSVQLEIKINDKPSSYQLEEQARERKADGVYEFIYNPDQFFEWYENFITSISDSVG